MSAPKVFVSHASEDKNRFVLQFAEKLRANGVDAWLDKWEMLPGDSLVNKIFDDGLAQASTVLIVLSKNSVSKPWVTEELNTAVVKRINSKIKLIPIVIDDCQIPECLTSILWERISNLESYDESFNRVIAAITGQTTKPPLGNLPSYTTSPIKEISGLARVDNLLLKIASQISLDQGHDLIDAHQLQNIEELNGLGEQELDDSIAILEQKSLVKAIRHMGGGLPHFRVTTYGFQQFGQAYIDNYVERLNRIALTIINQNLQDNHSIATQLSENTFFVDHCLLVLELNQYLKLARAIGGHIFIVNVHASLRRAFM
ncbi:toll/interleukin-1 receptor domain-containing protein [Methylophilus sp. OH31]|uniref:toll/interleukin-1 receptor domain-containing protein n=1 Tax=Methylophilus sp. OH31 TaxID=1387312 RepID=UPI0004655FEF|nr:toll/interleukin-1 receptor domain-containing protein [Methylophilus sp. OH31]